MRSKYSLHLLILLPAFCAFVSYGKDLSSLKPPVEETMTKQTTNKTTDSDSLEKAIREIHERAKREASGDSRPYSAYMPLSRSHRYRYPLYKKRAFDYVEEEEEPFFSDLQEEPDDEAFFDYTRPSPFRERERGEIAPLISNAHFTDNIQQKKKSSSYSKLHDAPYDLQAIAKLYEQGKRTLKNLPTTERFLNTVDAIANKMNGEYYHPGRIHEPFPQNAIARRKRKSDILSYASIPPKASNSLNHSANHSMRNSSTSLDGTSGHTKEDNSRNRLNSIKVTELRQKTSDRYKRAFLDDRALTDDEKRLRERENDFLTREYFKTIARSVGNKKKRMAYAQFEAPDKRSNGFDAFLNNPSMLHYVQEQIREAEKDVAAEAEAEFRSHIPGEGLEDPRSQALMSNTIARLDALEKMKNALEKLERLQEEDVIRKRAMNLASGYDREEMKRQYDVEKRRKAPRERPSEREDRRKKSRDDVIEDLFGENKREECPVLDRIVLNCLAITELVGDEDKAFLEPCLNHEICYMCGSGLDVTQHECDALLSSALEAGCSDEIPVGGAGSLDCLSAAGDTFNALADPNRYDDKGTCTHDPCVRQLLDSR